MKKYDVTIGIPIYNSVDCIQASLMSALSQSYPSIEILLVDDGCTDGTMDVVKQIVCNHERENDVRIVKHQTNMGVSASRNQIIDEALGEYLYFMDSDDTITENAIELLMQSARCYAAEVVFGSYEKIETSGSKTVYQYPSLQLLKMGELASFAYRKYAGVQASSCNFLVKTKLLRDNNLRFIDTDYWEDFVFTFDLVTYISRAVLLPDITYYYRCRENSLSHYQHRDNISKDEVMQNVKSISYLKKNSSAYINKGYFPNRCFNLVMTDFYIACNILKRRESILPFVSNNEIKALMAHPATWNQICYFSQARIKNMFMYMLSKLPAKLCVATIWCLGKYKKLI
ncbi:glycosyltransferase family 2 protein [Prevotella sp. RM4]|uniref:glycosyltransferase family 2 protein n=1 Tax=Prevotella sp. RM4 TaxID=1200547 RepID=UPI00051C1ABF|nr:glycosyltransferase family 2 protein [Prevotella sp. RM4]